jgi:hypothetical protein
MFLLRSDVRFTPVLRSNWSFGGSSSAVEPAAAKPSARPEKPRPEPVTA